MAIRQKVLLVDRDKDFCDYLSVLVAEHGYECLLADTGEEATRMASSHCPDLILMEQNLSDMNAIQVVQSVREWSLLPIIVLSEHSEERMVAELLDVGADDYIVKPIRPLELLARMRTAIRHTRTVSGDLQFANSGKIVIGHLTVDYDKYRVFVNETDAGLTQNEFRMVGLLARYNGKVLTYKRVMQELWGPNVGDDNQILRVNMANIRKKIEDDALQPKYLFTENGVGYRMVSQEEAAQWK